MKEFSTINTNLLAEQMGVTYTQAYRIKRKLCNGLFAEYLTPAFRAIHRLTGKTPNDIIPYTDNLPPLAEKGGAE